VPQARAHAAPGSKLSALVAESSAKLWIALINATANWSQGARTRLAAVIGDLLWWVVVPRRRITLINLRLCFPALSEQQRIRIARRCFRNIARSGLDRSVLSKGERLTVERYVKVQGIEHLQAAAGGPLILIAPHFVGLDAGGIRFNTLMRGISIYSKQTNAVWDAWLLMARQRFNDPVLMARQGADMRSVIRSVRSGLPLYYLPDMDLGAANSIFVPFFGVPAATIPMVPRIARIIGARVMMAVTEMTDEGYLLHFEPPWPDFPGESIEADTARMNREIERWVLKMPDQYLWTHRRFKTQPAGLPGLYGRASRTVTR
jgi:Kdo2-lipid IVA lauroyltransferase/acyltransferase